MTNELTTSDFQALDRLDENQIIAELQGAVAQDMVYSFRSGGKQVTGLSWSGIKHLAARLGNIQVDLLQVLDNEDSWCVLCKAQVGESSRIGASEQPKTITKRDGTVTPDPFALPKATSKAQRNAIRALLPEKLILETIAAHAAIPAQARPAQAPPANGKPANGNGSGSDEAKKLYARVKSDFGLSNAQITTLIKSGKWDKITRQNTNDIYVYISRSQNEEIDF